MDNSSIFNVLHEATATLNLACKNDPHLRGLLSFLNSSDLSCENMNDVDGSIPAHASLLDAAIQDMPDTSFPKLKPALAAAKDQLHWRVDDGGFYTDEADVGEGYKTGNMHALLIGPENCPIKADDFLLGFFLLAPRTLYRDHKHLAPEIYVPLTGPNGWRFGSGDWGDRAAGDVIYNEPNVVHATRVYDIPFLSLFAWVRDIGSACSVVYASDWPEIEAELTTLPRD